MSFMKLVDEGFLHLETIMSPYMYGCYRSHWMLLEAFVNNELNYPQKLDQDKVTEEEFENEWIVVAEDDA
jgi:GR25 family glycosyltransferase involved in LPS biosynthesis